MLTLYYLVSASCLLFLQAAFPNLRNLLYLFEYYSWGMSRSGVLGGGSAESSGGIEESLQGRGKAVRHE